MSGKVWLVSLSVFKLRSSIPLPSFPLQPLGVDTAFTVTILYLTAHTPQQGIPYRPPTAIFDPNIFHFVLHFNPNRRPATRLKPRYRHKTRIILTPMSSISRKTPLHGERLLELISSSLPKKPRARMLEPARRACSWSNFCIGAPGDRSVCRASRDGYPVAQGESHSIDRPSRPHRPGFGTDVVGLTITEWRCPLFLPTISYTTDVVFLSKMTP